MATRYKNKKIAFLGDSITLGYSLEDKSERFSSVLCQRLGAQEYNFGITGTLIARCGMNRADGNSFTDRAHLLSGYDLCVIFGGTNDYFWSETPISAPGKTGDDYYINALKTLFDKTAAMYSANNVLIVTPYPHNGIGNYQGGASYTDSCRHDTSQPNFHGFSLIDYVTLLDKKAAEYGFNVLNLHAVPGFDHKTMTTDGCHPNVSGHIWLADRIQQKLLTLTY